MGPTPAKRQKQLVEPPDDEVKPTKRRQTEKPVSSSDSRNAPSIDTEKRGTRKRQPTTRSHGNLRHSKTSTTSRTSELTASPQKEKQKPSAKGQGSQSLYTFFTPSAERQRSPSANRSLEKEDVEEDTIEDDFPDETSNLRLPSRQASAPEGATKTENVKTKSVLPANKAPRASQRFLKASADGSTSAGSSARSSNVWQVDDNRPWAEKYAPISLDELAVHKKKVSDVSNWLSRALKGLDRKRLLVLKGPSGSGKTTTLSLLSRALGFDILEWRNPLGAEYSSDGYVSASAQFGDFIGRGGKFGSLEFAGTGTPSASKPTAAVTPTQASGKQKVILIEEFPSASSRQSASLQNFRSTILQYLAATTSSTGNFFASSESPAAPIVMVITETLLTTSTAAADSFTAHRLLGPQIMNHTGTSVMEFNPIAPTFLSKALDLIIKKEARISGRRKAPSSIVLQTLGGVGDIRSAVASLEFLCLRGDEAGDWGGRVAVAVKGKRGATDGTKLTKMERDSLELVTQREASLGIFHAVGKVMYNKREDPAINPAEERPPQPPNHLPQHHRPKVSQVSVDDLIDATGTDTQTFVAALHENYILSCDNSSSEDAMDAINGCIDAISDSDLLAPEWTGGFGSGRMGGGFGRGAFQGASSDNLRQDEISFQLAVLGILFALPYPVKRRAPPASLSSDGRGRWNRGQNSRSDAYKMFFPSSLRLWRRSEEISDMVDLYMNQLIKDQMTADSSHTVTEEVGSVESRKHNTSSFNSSIAEHSSSTPTPSSQTNTSPKPSSLMIPSGNSARREMLLERLPYTALIQRRGNKSASSNLQMLDQITSFRGIGGASDELLDDEGDEDTVPPVRDWTTDRDPDSVFPGSRSASSFLPLKREPPARRQPAHSSRPPDTSGIPGLSFESQVQKLVLSDDDIEDD
ncbi:hypothetical protein L228DRAFT_238351 [Xylona heveae TC161]|uniref:Checkpoint protein RAD24-like helical bundle domain-containing protein n=1 Tax=Xylona heveae (strain CBS 132557 / TC161) TaxID=1328760 RepID=A0A165HQH6_XYLHT|nr:hypothetical protein L228DRAFT_238351 [Xylona heveae TC161]KZF23835.1 hypothetical protein L228DRAFT_238351 [Xylona heveae TC161]